MIDQSEALKAYTRSHKLSREMQDDVAEYSLYAKRQMGIISASLVREKPGIKPAELCPEFGHNSKIDTLASAGIDRRRANEAEKLAAIPEDEFTEIIAAKREAEDLSNTSVLNAAKARQAKIKQSEKRGKIEKPHW